VYPGPLRFRVRCATARDLFTSPGAHNSVFRRRIPALLCGADALLGARIAQFSAEAERGARGSLCAQERGFSANRDSGWSGDISGA
jgi:hypothetical protein